MIAFIRGRRHVLTRLILPTLLLAIGGAWYAALPPQAGALPAATDELPTFVRGVTHVHSIRSDGTADMGSIAAAAARAGLDFVILSDHGDATREPDPPQYLEGVLCIDAVEISTHHGHVVALGLPPAPYPLAGEARDVIEDIARVGGFAIAAHPGSPRVGLQWTGWDLPIGGVEWMNADSEWRDESHWSLARALLTFPARGTESILSLLDRPVATLRQWDEMTRRRRVVAVAGTDAHARISFPSIGEPYGNGRSLHVPSYERMFRVFSNALPRTTFSGDAAADARTVYAALRSGHVYSVIDGLGGPAAFEFTAASGGGVAEAGDVLPIDGPVTLRVRVQAPDTARIQLLKDGEVQQTITGARLDQVVDAEPAVYRVEVQLSGAPGSPPVPWIVSNPIYVGRDGSDAPPTAAARRPSRFAMQYGSGPATGWTVETSPESLGALDATKAVRGTELSLRYGLGGTASSSPFAAFVMPAGSDLPNYDRLMFTARASSPMRLSVQARAPSGDAGERWQRSVFLDSTPRVVTVFFDDMTPSGATSAPRPALADVQSILFVVDTLNTPLGGNGTIWIDEVQYGR